MKEVLKVEVKKKEIADLTIGGKVFKGMELDTSIPLIDYYVSKRGKVALLKDSNDIFSSFFDIFKESIETTEGLVIMASGDILEHIQSTIKEVD